MTTGTSESKGSRALLGAAVLIGLEGLPGIADVKLSVPASILGFLALSGLALWLIWSGTGERGWTRPGRIVSTCLVAVLLGFVFVPSLWRRHQEGDAISLPRIAIENHVGLSGGEDEVLTGDSFRRFRELEIAVTNSSALVIHGLSVFFQFPEGISVPVRIPFHVTSAVKVVPASINFPIVSDGTVHVLPPPTSRISAFNIVAESLLPKSSVTVLVRSEVDADYLKDAEAHGLKFLASGRFQYEAQGDSKEVRFGAPIFYDAGTRVVGVGETFVEDGSQTVLTRIPYGPRFELIRDGGPDR